MAEPQPVANVLLVEPRCLKLVVPSTPAGAGGGAMPSFLFQSEPHNLLKIGISCFCWLY